MNGRRILVKLDEDTLLRLDVKIDDSFIEQVSSHKILGVVTDSQMNYESHIDELCKKLSKHIGLLKHIRISEHGLEERARCPSLL